MSNTTEAPTAETTPSLGGRIKGIFARKREEEAESAGAEYARLISLPVEDLTDAEAIRVVELGQQLGFIAADGADAAEVVDRHRDRLATARKIHQQVVEMGTASELSRKTEERVRERNRAHADFKAAENLYEDANKRVFQAQHMQSSRRDRVSTLKKIATSHPFLPIPTID